MIIIESGHYLEARVLHLLDKILKCSIGLITFVAQMFKSLNRILKAWSSTVNNLAWANFSALIAALSL